MARRENLEVNKLVVNKIMRPPVSTTDWRIVSGGQFATTNSSATDTIQPYANLTPGSHPTFVTPVVNGATVKYPLKIAGAVPGVGTLLTQSTTAVTGDKVNYAVMDQGNVDPLYDVFAAGTAGAATGTTVVVTIPGLLTTDLAFVTKRIAGTAASVLNSAVCTANTLTLTVASTMLASNTFDYVVLRRAGDFTPSHRIIAAAYAAFDPDAAAGTITVSGVVATDILMVTPNVNNTNLLLYAAPTADTLTLTFAGDPATAAVSYMVLRP